jgi:hypothetical protein
VRWKTAIAGLRRKRRIDPDGVCDDASRDYTLARRLYADLHRKPGCEDVDLAADENEARELVSKDRPAIDALRAVDWLG